MRPVAGAVAKQHLRQPGVGEGKLPLAQQIRRGGAHQIHGGLVAVTEEAGVELGIGIAVIVAGKLLIEYLHQFFPHFGVGAQQIQALAALSPVDAKLVRPLRRQGGGRRQHRAFVDVHQLHRNAGKIPEILFFGVEALAYLLAGELDERGGVAGEIHHDHRVLVAGVPGERRHPACAPLPGGEHAGDVYQRLHGHHVDEGLHLVLVAKIKEIIEQLGLGLFYQPGHLDGGQHVGERIVGVGVGHAIGDGELLQFEARLALFVKRPLDPLRAQGVAGPQHVENVPAGVAVLPAVGIGVIEVAIEGVAGHLVIEADAVVAQHAGAWGGELLVDLADEIRLAQPVLHRFLWRDAGDEARLRLRQIVRRRLAIDDQRLADEVEIRIGTNAGKLRRSVPGRADAESLVIVEVEGRLAAGVCCFAHVACDEVSDDGGWRLGGRCHAPRLPAW